MMSEEAKAAKRKYQREWYHRQGNAERHKERVEQYWERRAAREAAARDGAGQVPDEQLRISPAEAHTVPADCAGAVSDTMPAQCVNCPWRCGQMPDAASNKTN